jgi:glutamyl-tRNA synthetase
MADTVRVRFAPSPTGYLHVGGARSALFNYLFARRDNGTFILRIEDTDQSRFVEGALLEIYESLKWLGLQWDEGPEAGGAYGPYIQSQRLHIYKEYAQKLLESGHAYRCFCTPERITQLREEQEKAKQPSGYDRKCRGLSDDEITKQLQAGIPYVVRLKIPAGRKVVFTDKIRGAIEYSSDVLDDLVLIKSDGYPTYHMANVVDDHLMKITHVLRGDEWIASTPRHILLYEAFGWNPPEFAHLPIILSPDGGKLSKRKGAASVMDFKRAGFLPEALFNFLALLGWSPGDEREKMSLDELIDAFSLENVSPKSSVFDEQKLEWMNGVYLSEKNSQDLLSDCKGLWNERNIKIENYSNDYLCNVISLMKVRSKRITEIVDSSRYFLEDPVSYDEKAAAKQFTPDTVLLLENIINKLNELSSFTAVEIESSFKMLAEGNGISTGKLIHPTRLSISGVSIGPGLYEMMELLGKESVIRRISKAKTYIKSRYKND